MGAIDPSMEPMMEMFIFESTTLLEQLDEIMLESEKAKNISHENINEIFRIMHTIKGSSAMMGLTDISSLAHTVEDVFFIIREEPSKMEDVSEAIFDLVFQASDFLKTEIEAVQSDDYAPQDPSAIIICLEEQAGILKGLTPAQTTAQSAGAPESAGGVAVETVPAAVAVALKSEDKELHRVRIYFDDDCQMENIRAFMLMTQLKDWCDTVESEPAHPENDSSLCSEIIKNGFVVIFHPSSDPENVYKIIENSVNVKSYEILDEDESADVASILVEEAASEPSSTMSAAPAAESVPTPSSSAAPVANASVSMPKVAKQNLISVNQSKLDQLMDLVGELVTTESMVSNSPDLKGLTLDNFNKSTRELRKLTDELQDVVMSIRMVPLSGVFQKMNRIVRDMSKKLGKEVELVTLGGETEVDKTINDSIGDPFMHMIRNSVDHAIESPEERRALGKPEIGKVTISARNVGGEIVITIADDGRGLNTESILRKARGNGLLSKGDGDYTDKEIFGFIMLPGFSTNEQVTEFSGRGVGMDVVRKNIEKVGGTISIESERDVGTTFIIKIPLTLAILDGMEISVGDTLFTLPITSIKQSFKITNPNEVIHNTDNSEMIMRRGECYPIVRLHEIFSIPTQVTDLSDGIVIQVENGRKIACIFADELIGEPQVVVKPFPPFLNKYGVKGRGLSGCTILGDGSISLILDANTLFNN